MTRWMIIPLFALAMAWAGCTNSSSSDKGTRKAGEACEATPVGATKCESNVCLDDLQCTSGAVLDVCAGGVCTTDQDCPAGNQCAPAGSTSYCVPTNVCDTAT